MASAPLEIHTVVDRVYAEVRRRIVEGELPRASKLRQEPLAGALGVSRTPLRAALRRLAAEGLVEFHPNRGAFVVALSTDDVRAAYEARLVFEPGAARLAAARRPAAPMAAMRAALVDQLTSTDTRSAYGASRAFHLALAQASGNEHLVRLAEALWMPGLAQAIYERQVERSEHLIDDADEHQRILAAIELGDGEMAARLTTEHIRAALEQLLGD
jgi:DNA-binding GntR family transcriptional regulator